MAELIPGLDMGNILASSQGTISNIITYVGYILIAIIALIGIYALILYFEYGIKCTIFPVYNTGKETAFHIGKKKKQRFKWNKQKTAWKPLFPLFNKEEVAPFDYMYPKNRVYAIKVADKLIPCKKEDVEEIISDVHIVKEKIVPVPAYVRNWQSLTHKRHELEFADQNFWEQNKMLFMVIGCVIVCAILCGVTIYLSYGYAAGGQQVMQGLTQALQNFNPGSFNAPQ